MKNKNIIYKVFATVTIFVLAFIFIVGFLNSSEKNSSISTVSPTNNQINVVETPRVGTLSVVTKTLDEGESSNVKINFVVGTSSYSVLVPEGSTVYDAMNILASTTPFNFVAKNYSGLGYFIEEINGIKNSNSMYWTLYVNGVYSTVGASEYVLLQGDEVEWKYEK